MVTFQEECLVTFQAWDLYHGVAPKTVKGFKKVEYGYLSLDLLDLKNMQSQSLSWLLLCCSCYFDILFLLLL